jgi:hypothetical protein
VAILTGVIAVAELVAGGAVIELAAQGFGAAVFDGFHHPQVRGRHLLLKPGSVIGSMKTKDIGQLDGMRFFEALISPPSGDE